MSPGTVDALDTPGMFGLQLQDQNTTHIVGALPQQSLLGAPGLTTRNKKLLGAPDLSIPCLSQTSSVTSWGCPE